MKTVDFDFIDIDFETRSKADIKKVGAYRYADDDSTEILLLRISYDQETTEGWRIGDPPPKKLFKRLKKKNTRIRAFNSFFEYSIWNLVGARKLGWPEMSIEKFYDVMADSCQKCFAANLEGAAEQMELVVQKDNRGKNLIQKFSKPSRRNGHEWNQPDDFPIEFQEFDEYCEVDVLTQIGIAEFTGTLTRFEHMVFLLTEKMNARGLPIDIDMAEGALDLVEYATDRANEEARKITKDAFNSVTQRDAVMNWLEDNGCPMPNMQAKTIERMLKNPKKKIRKKARRILELRAAVSKTSTSKYSAALMRVGKDNRVHEIVKYHIAKTGRHGGRGLQIQNFARPTLGKWVDYEYIAELITNRDFETLEMLYGEVMNVLSSALRSMICAPDGKKFVCADYAQIEARIVFWFADEQQALNIFREGGDIYCDMAIDVYKRPITKANDFERFIGKQCILGLGFGMGASKFKGDLFEKGDVVVEASFATEVVNLYRKKYKKVKNMWKEVSDAAMDAVEHPNRKFYCCDKKIHYVYDEESEFLYCVLPSGRRLHYYRPIIKYVDPPKSWNTDDMIPQLTFMGIDGYTKKWTRLRTYGGSLVENFVQAAARDIMCYGMLEAENEGYEQIFLVHDESVALVDEDFGSYQEYEKVLSRTPDWAKGIPVVAEGWEGKRYRK